MVDKYMRVVRDEDIEWQRSPHRRLFWFLRNEGIKSEKYDDWVAPLDAVLEHLNDYNNRICAEVRVREYVESRQKVENAEEINPIVGAYEFARVLYYPVDEDGNVHTHGIINDREK